MKPSSPLLSRPSKRSPKLWSLAVAASLLAVGGWSQWPGAIAQPAAPTSPIPVAPAATQPSPLASLPPPAGEAIAHTCAACHGTQGRLGDEAFMPLAGMPRVQFVRTMQDFRSGARPSTLMGHVAQGFTDADVAAMGAYFESLTERQAAR